MISKEKLNCVLVGSECRCAKLSILYQPNLETLHQTIWKDFLLSGMPELKPLPYIPELKDFAIASK